MKIRPGETRYRTSIYYVTDDQGVEHRVTATRLDDADQWVVICHTCNPYTLGNKKCNHSDAVLLPLLALS